MENNYAVMESKTGVILVEGSRLYCYAWMKKNCTHNEKYDLYKDADHEAVEIVAR